jgi:hypothetical protein
MQMATSRPRDPMWYWRQNNLPIEFDKEAELKRVREFTRLLYITHPVVSSCIDIFSEYPMQGMRFECKSKELEEFYSELFFDQLDYETHLLRVGREYWKVGEAFTLGGWNETLGVWESDQLINPDDVELEAGLFLNEPRYLMKLPDQLKQLIASRSPRWQFEQLRGVPRAAGLRQPGRADPGLGGADEAHEVRRRRLLQARHPDPDARVPDPDPGGDAQLGTGLDRRPALHAVDPDQVGCHRPAAGHDRPVDPQRGRDGVVQPRSRRGAGR